MLSSIHPVGVAIVGCGAISGIYFQNVTSKFSILKLIACCDLNTALAEEKAQMYGIKVMTLQQIIADPVIEIVINLTAPAAHYHIIQTLLNGGKNVYTEKVLAVKLEQAAELVSLADHCGLMLCAAPDTFLGAAGQTARYAIEHGLIGEVTSCVAVLQRDAALLAEKFPYTASPGGGIGIDVGIYYITELLHLLGPCTRVCGISHIHQAERIHFFTSKGQLGQPYTIQAETLLAATIQFASGAVGSLHFNSGSIRNENPYVAVFGTQGILYLPDPNFFGGEVRILAKGQTTPYVHPFTHAYDGDERGLGAADMAWALRTQRTPRTHKEMAYHALEVLCGAVESGKCGSFYTLGSTFKRQPLIPRGYLGASYAMSEPEASLFFQE